MWVSAGEILDGVFNGSIGSEYIFHIETLSDLLIIGKLYVIWTEIHFQDAFLFITFSFY